VTEPLASPAAPVPVMPTGSPWKPVASYLHTFLIVALLCAVGVMSMLTLQRGGAAVKATSLYLQTIIWLWALSLLVYFGLRRHGTRLRDIFGQTWQSFDDALMDIGIFVGFWIAAMAILVGANAILMKITGTPAPKSIPTELQMLAPKGALGLSLWLILSVSAGICEEFVFRGYLQRQFSALARNAAAGIVLSALVFSVGHLYEGIVKAGVIGVFGILLGTLAYVRRSLAPGMLAHAWHDIFAGLLLYVLPHWLQR